MTDVLVGKKKKTSRKTKTMRFSVIAAILLFSSVYVFLTLKTSYDAVRIARIENETNGLSARLGEL